VEPKRLCGGRFNHLPNVDAHSQAEKFQFVDQGDVYAAIDIFKKLGHFRYLRGRYRNSPVEDGSVESAGQFCCHRTEAADDLRNIASGDRVVAGIFAFGGERDEEGLVFVLATRFGFKAERVVVLQNLYHYFFGCSRISGAFKNNELIWLQVRRQRLQRGGDIRHIRLAMLIERSRNTNDDGVHPSELGVISGGLETAAAGGLNVGSGDTTDIGPPL
jgi:hypothetical protein